MTRRVVTHTALVLILLLAACTEEDDAGSESVPTFEITTPASGTPSSYRWAVCRLESAYLDYETVDEVEVSFGFRDPDRGTLRADHVWGVSSEHERRVQLADLGEHVVRRYVSRVQAAGPYRDNLSEDSRERPVSVDELRTRHGVLEAFGLTGAPSVANQTDEGPHSSGSSRIRHPICRSTTTFDCSRSNGDGASGNKRRLGLGHLAR